MKKFRINAKILLSLTALLSFSVAGNLVAATIHGLGLNQFQQSVLFSFDSATPGTLLTGPTAITGLGTGEQMECIDFRPSDMAMFGLTVLGNSARLYQVNPSTAAATAVGTAFTLSNSSASLGCDFDPVSGLLRVVSQLGDNFRVNVNAPNFTVTPDTAITTNADINAIAYDRNMTGATVTTLFGIDSTADTLVRIGDVDGTPISPNGGALNTVGVLGVNIGFFGGLDIDASGAAFLTGSSNQFFTVNLATGSAASVGAINFAFSIKDIAAELTGAPPQPGSLQFNVTSVSVDEGDGATMEVKVIRVGGSDGIVSVDVDSENGSATAGNDFQAVDQTLQFGDGDTNAKTLTVTISQDTDVEGDEAFNLKLSNPQGGASLGSPISTTFTIADDDVAPQQGTLQFDVTSVSVDEGDGATMEVKVTRVGGSDGIVSVDVDSENGSATAGSDFQAVDQTLQFGDGDTNSQTLTVTISQDPDVEGDETFNLKLSNPQGGATLGSPISTTFTIADDDVAPQQGTLQFNLSSLSVGEEDGPTMLLKVIRIGGSDGIVSVDVDSENLSAGAGSDFDAVHETIQFADGDTDAKTLTIKILPDTKVEGDETFNLELSNPQGGALLGSPTSTLFTIVDDDEAVPPPGPPDIKVAKTIVPNVAQCGEAVTNTITVTNIGGQNATTITLRDQIIPGLSYASVTTNKGDCDEVTDTSSAFFCRLDNLAPGESMVIEAILNISAEGNYGDLLTAVHATNDSNISNDSVSVGLFVRGGECTEFGAGCRMTPGSPIHLPISGLLFALAPALLGLYRRWTSAGKILPVALGGR